jgi:hypothetical protein
MGARSQRAVPNPGDPLVQRLPRPIVQRVPVETLGGSFNTHKYEVHDQAAQGDDPHRSVGADMWLDFTPNDFVKGNATAIGLVQTVKTLRSTEAAQQAAPNQSFTPADSPFKAAYKLTEGDVGRGIDKRDRSENGLTNTNPVYASDTYSHALLNTPRYSTALSDAMQQPGLGHNWSSGDAAKPARLIDRPRYVLEFANQALRQSFEVVALVLSGKFANTYLGSIAWGVTVAAGEPAQLDPAAIQLVNTGIPSGPFMAAARAWNSYNGGKRDVSALEAGNVGVADGKVDAVKLPDTRAGMSSPTQIGANADALILQIGAAVQARPADETATEKANAGFAIAALERRLIALKQAEDAATLAAWVVAGSVAPKPLPFDETSDAYVDVQLADATNHTAATRDKVKSDLMFIML